MTEALRKGTPTPLHDELVAWTHRMVEEDSDSFWDELLGGPDSPEQVAETLRREWLAECRALEKGDPGVAANRAWEIKCWDDELEKSLQEVEDADTSWEVGNPEWEAPIDNGRGVIVGYVDLKVTVTRRTAALWFPQPFSWSWEPVTWTVYFEIKPEIPSAGELLRQINKYRHYVKPKSSLHKIAWVVVSPDTRFAKLLASQDVKLVTPHRQMSLPSLEQRRGGLA